MCLVLRRYFEVFANSLAPSLSLNTLHLVVIFDTGSLINGANSTRSSLNSNKSLILWERAIYSASVVLRAILVWSLLTHIIGQPNKNITNPVRDQQPFGSSDDSLS